MSLIVAHCRSDTVRHGSFLAFLRRSFRALIGLGLLTLDDVALEELG
jgi:hypothetical protein